LNDGAAVHDRAASEDATIVKPANETTAHSSDIRSPVGPLPIYEAVDSLIEHSLRMDELIHGRLGLGAEANHGARVRHTDAERLVAHADQVRGRGD